MQRVRELLSHLLKSILQRDIFKVKCFADFFDNPQKKPHGSFEVVCGCRQKYIFHYILMQLRIRGISHVLFLHRGVDKNRIVMIPIVILRIDADAFRKDEFHVAFTGTLAKMYKLTRVTWIARRKF